MRSRGAFTEGRSLEGQINSLCTGRRHGVRGSGGVGEKEKENLGLEGRFDDDDDDGSE